MSMSDPFNYLGSIWYNLEPLEVPYSPNQFLVGSLFCRFLQQTGSSNFTAWVWFLAYFEACCLNLHRKFERKEVGKQIRNRISDDLFLMIGLISKKSRNFLSQIQNLFMTLQTKSFFLQ